MQAFDCNKATLRGESMKQKYEKPEVFSEGAFETLGDTGCTWVTTQAPECDPVNTGTLLAMGSV